MPKPNTGKTINRTGLRSGAIARGGPLRGGRRTGVGGSDHDPK